MELTGHTIIAGFGLPGRAIAQVLDEQKQSYCVIELNPQTAQRCELAGVPIISGDVRDERCLREAGIEHATLLALAIPDEHAVLEAIPIVRRINPTIRIIARCAYTSAGLKAIQSGASEVVIAEKVVATEFSALMRRGPASDDKKVL